MALRPETLSRNPDRLIEMVLACEGNIEALEATIAKLRAIIFGARSEKSAVIIAEPLSLALGEGDENVAVPPPANDDGHDDASGNEPAAETRKKRKRNIGALPAHLPRVDVTIEPETTTCPCCAVALHRIGEDFNDVLDRAPAVLRIPRTIRPKYACRACEGAVVQAKARPRLIEAGMASTALVAWIAAAKYAWGSTLYRQSQILAGHGLNIDRQTLARWMKQVAWMAKGLYELQLTAMHGYSRLFCDETPVRVQDPGRGRTKTCQFWAHAMDDRSWKGPAPPAVAYVFAGGRGKKEIATQLSGFEGVVLVEAMPPTRRWRATRRGRGKSVWRFVSFKRAGTSSTSIRRRTLRSPKRSSSALRRSTGSKSESAVSTPTSVAPSGRPRPSR
jgi:transposase